MKDAPLKVEIKDSELIIRIGTGTLVFCSSNKNGGPLGNEFQIDGRRHIQFARDIARELERDDEQGGNPLNRMLEQAMVDAVEAGSMAVKETT